MLKEALYKCGSNKTNNINLLHFLWKIREVQKKRYLSMTMQIQLTLTYNQTKSEDVVTNRRKKEETKLTICFRRTRITEISLFIQNLKMRLLKRIALSLKSKNTIQGDHTIFLSQFFIIFKLVLKKLLFFIYCSKIDVIIETPTYKVQSYID
jgi:hypothetical protein